MDIAQTARTADRFEELFGGPLETQTSDDESARRFRSRVATLDRAFLGVTIFATLQSAYYIWAWGFDSAFSRLIGDGLGFGILVSIFLVPALLLATLYPRTRVRRTALAGLLFSSYAMGYGLWCFSVLVAWETAGKAATIAGVAAGVVGVIPVAIVGAILDGSLAGAAGIAAVAALTVTLRRFVTKRID